MLNVVTSRRRTGRRPLLAAACPALLVVGLVACAHARAAFAQDAPPERRYVRVGTAELAPKVTFGGEYDSNAYHEQDHEHDVFSIVVEPSATLAHKTESTILDAHATYHLQKYLDFKKAWPHYANLDRYRDGHAGLKLQILPKAPAGVNLDGRLVSTDRPSEALYSPASALIHRFTSQATGHLVARPGQALEFQGGMYVMWDDYKVPETANPEMNENYNSRLSYAALLQGRWKFFPRTTVVLDGKWEWFEWDNNLINIQSEPGVEPGAHGSYLGSPDGDMLKVRAGLQGKVTERLGVNLSGGWVWGTYDEQSVLDEAALLIPDLEASVDDDLSQGFGRDVQGIDRLTVTLVGEYAVDQASRFSAGYVRDVQDVYFTNYLVYDYVYGKYRRIFTPRFGAAVEGGYRREAFRGEVSRDDHVLRAKGDLTYAINRWLSTTVGVWWDERASVGGVHPDVEFDNVNVHLHLIATY